jgi:hypothetical protein
MSRLFNSAFAPAVALAAGLALLPAAAGAQGAGFASYSATVNAAGSIVFASGVQSSARPAKGGYVVQFTREVTGCAFLATPIGKTGGQASVSPVPGQPTAVAIATFSKTGKRSNRPFVLLVSCS